MGWRSFQLHTITPFAGSDLMDVLSSITVIFMEIRLDYQSRAIGRKNRNIVGNTQPWSDCAHQDDVNIQNSGSKEHSDNMYAKQE